MRSIHKIMLICSSAVVLLAMTTGVCWGWLFDGGVPQHAGAVVQEGTSLGWAAAIFRVESDSYGTEFGLAVSRAAGPADAGFTVYLVGSLVDVENNAIASWTITPASPVLDYYFNYEGDPVFLQAGVGYALVAVPNHPDFIGAISYSPQGYYGWGSGDYGESWYMLPLPLSVRVDGYAVPEPGCAAVWLLGCAGLVRGRMRRVFRA